MAKTFIVPVVAGMLVMGCQGFDPDLRGNAAGGLDTATAARAATQDRPEPDDRGLITYPNYQVAVARRGDTVATVASRVGVDAQGLASFNGMSTDTQLAPNAVLALQSPVGGSGLTGGRPDIAGIAGAAIDRAGSQAAPAVQGGPEPVRHKVARGETAFTIARLYGVSPRSLAEWNGLGSDLAVREGQFLLIPVVIGEAGAEPVDAAAPGASATPVPPSAASALPETIEAEPLPESPNLDQFRTEASAEVAEPEPEPVVVAVEPDPEPEPEAAPSGLRRPVRGEVLRGFSSRNEGLDFAAAEGAPVFAAASGTVAAITEDTDQVPILVLRHPDGLLTVYANVSGVRVGKGDNVSAGQRIASVGAGDPSFLHFEVRRGFDAVDPAPLLQ
ncbi:peptidoglycan DD-metalloendopeptidase family protein [Jannaschia sp. Os4]|uniref:peptidoglycan DD-metalloendopeptidase family protein n=1 Tax=Jannaschia sp. Os4 TaxID=2807617 RepID=UPI00193AD6E0|nr:M23 family metallopeptidase [Jannaschia sp. Os4]MBM2576753.1 peptidoglycan DD-metalloendopeptidase family protein [Jannaschia sp. Os4]